MGRCWRTEGEAGLTDRSSRPHTTPHRTAAAIEARVCRLRQDRKLGPARIGPILGLPASTAHRVLTRHGLNRLAYMDRPTGTVIRRYERDRPGELVHVDIKKPGNIPDGGGHRVLTRQTGETNRQATTPARSPSGTPKISYSFIHTAVDDHSRLAYSEIHTDERKETAVAFWHRAQAFFDDNGITVERVLTDNDSCYRSHAWRQALATAGITHKRTPALPTTDQRESRTLQPHPARRMGLPASLHQQHRTSRSVRTLPARLQPPPQPHRTRRRATHHPRQQPCGSIQLAEAWRATRKCWRNSGGKSVVRHPSLMACLIPLTCGALPLQQLPQRPPPA